jgi:parvulin-like peptidyl-prolyl isomerase
VQRIQRTFAIIFTLVLVAASLAACNRDKDAKGKSDASVAATVNGKPILLSEIDTIVSRQTQGQQSRLSTIQLAALRLQILDGLINEQLLLQRAEKEKLIPSEDEITAAVNGQLGRLTPQEKEQFLQQLGLNEQGLREQARKELAIRKLQEKVVSKVTIQEQEIVDFYNANQSRYVNARGVFLSAIIADSLDSKGAYPGDALNDSEAKAKIDRIQAQLQGGEDFATLARANSEDPRGVNGGDLGFATEEAMRQRGIPLEVISELMDPKTKAGHITKPISFPDGRWVIFKMTERRDASENLTLDNPDVRNDIKDALIGQQQEILMQALVKNALSEAQIVNNLAKSMLDDPATLGGFRPAQGAAPAATPASGS